jgi:hypothetical protein
MTFTFDENLATDRDFVRYHTADTIEAEAHLSDELIDALILTYSRERAVIEGLTYIIARLSQPDVAVGELRVDYQQAVAAKRALLQDKRKAFGLAGITGSAIQTRRTDT